MHMFNSSRALEKGLSVLMMMTVLAGVSPGQVADGNLTGVILDPSGAAVVNASVGAENLGTGYKVSAITDSIGTYRFNNLVVGFYKITASAPGFQTTTLASVAVELSKTTTAHVTLTVGKQTDTLTVTDTPTLIDAATAQIANIFTTRMSTDLPVASNTTGGYLNLSLLGAGVASSGGVGAGTGPSIGGQRPRNNNYAIEGADNNRKDITGPLVLLPNDSVQEFTVLQNQFSPDFGHSSGGQFNTVIRGGTNQLHGKFYEYFQNRYLNAQDEAFKRQGTSQRTRYDQNIVGANLGGPLKKDKAFYFGSLDYNPLGRNSTTGAARYAPTAAGYTTLSSIPTVSQNNLNVLKQYVGAAPLQDGDYAVAVQGSLIPLGIVPITAPSYSNTYRGLASMDYNISSKDQLRGRYVQNRSSSIDTGAQTPAFWTLRPTTSYLASISEFHTFSPSLTNEVRVAYNRFNDRRSVQSGQNFPGLDVFPTIGLTNDLNLVLGPFTDAPQATTQNTYQVVDNMTWNVGRHDIKFGFDGRDAISSMDFVLQSRGDYRYSSLNRYLIDQTPDQRAVRNVGGKPYFGNANSFYLYANDNWKVTRKLTLNLGMRWEYNGIAKSMKEQALNSLADVPGVLTFAAPKPQLKNFAPRLGFAYSPGNSGTTSIRGGFGLAYDQIFDNVGNNVRGPQAVSAFSVAANSSLGFLANGAIPYSAVPAALTPVTARAATTGWLPNQKLGYAVNWNFGIQHSFAKDYVVDVRYVGTRGVHLLLQTMLNRVAQVTQSNSLPVYLTRPSQDALNALPLTLNQLQALSGNINPLAQYGFTNSLGITSYVPQGNSIYHGLAVDVTKRFSKQLMFKGGYTWSHLRDDSTAEINTTTLSPRRPQDFGNLRPEWASSALDRRQRLTATWTWDTPWFRQNHNWFLRTVVAGYGFSGTYTAESPQWVTPQSVVDANLNGDNATDRVVVNPSGVKGTGSDVTALTNSSGQTVAYVAVNPNAEFLKAKAGVYANSGRNILQGRGINNFDLSVAKNFATGEHSRFEIRADFYNALNHAQYTAGRINNIASTQHVNETSYLTPGNIDFGRWDRVYPSNARNIQLVAKFSF
jgi:hypothetical protein